MQYPTTTKVTIETPDGICSLEVSNTNINLEDLIESLIIPALLGAGYSEEQVEKYRCEPRGICLADAIRHAEEAEEAEMRG